MNFFANQDQARRQTRYLIWLFLLAVLSIVLAINGAAWLLYKVTYSWAPLPNYFFVGNTVVVIGLIVGGTLMETWNLRDGGDAVAQMAGGRQIQPNTASLSERRLLNVVEEMSLASGVSMPNVYVLDGEEGINAFAAGYSPNQAVVAVTRGTLERLNRDELQGVVAHEFSHILHGDMRLNIQLIGAVYGLLLVALLGEKLLSSVRYGSRSSSSSRDSDGRAAILLLFAGMALWTLGYIGVFFGRVIKASISRQREYLADASAIQYTRNPDGIGSALRKIGGWSKIGRGSALGSEIHSPQAETLSHLFLGAARSQFASGWLAPPPPLEERIKRIYGRAMGMAAPEMQPDLETPKPTLPEFEYQPTSLASARAEALLNPVPGLVSAPVQPSSLDNTIGRPRASHLAYAQQLSPEAGQPSTPQQAAWQTLKEVSREPGAACALVYAMLFSDQQDMREKQHRLLQQAGAVAAQQAVELYPALKNLAPSLRLPLLDLTIPTLRSLDPKWRQQLLQHTQMLIAADGKVELEEFVLETILTQRLNTNARAATAVKYQRPVQLLPELDAVLALVACSAERAAKTDVLQARMQKAAEQLDIAGYAPLYRTPNLTQIKSALQKLNALNPLQKPALIKAMLRVAEQPQGISQRSTDLIHALCAALDSPLPPQVEIG